MKRNYGDNFGGQYRSVDNVHGLFFNSSSRTSDGEFIFVGFVQHA